MNRWIKLTLVLGVCYLVYLMEVRWYVILGVIFIYIATLKDKTKEIRDEHIKNPHLTDPLDIAKEFESINNELNKGISIVGGAGSGKTYSLIVPLISVF